MRGKLLPVLLLTLAALAGCADPDPARNAPSLEVTKDTGGIRGVVVDEAIRPLGGAKVFLIDDPSTSVTTGPDGLFAITGLVPGAYGVRATRLAHAPSSAVVDVVAGVADPPAVRLILERLASGEPYMVTWKEDGFISCSSNLGAAKSEECGEGVGVPGAGRVGKNPNNRAQIDFFVDGGHIKTLIVELSWQPNTEVGAGEDAGQFDSRVALNWTCDPSCSGNELVTAVGPPPLYMRIDQKQLEALDITAETVFSTFTWAEDNPGVLIEQEYQAFISAFYHAPAPEGWSFVAGDEPPF